MTHGQAKRLMDRLRDGDSHIVGEYRECEIIEIHANVLYDRCYFSNCRFIVYGHAVFFHGCTILSAAFTPEQPMFVGRWEYLWLEECLAGCGPEPIEV